MTKTSDIVISPVDQMLNVDVIISSPSDSALAIFQELTTLVLSAVEHVKQSEDAIRLLIASVDDKVVIAFDSADKAEQWAENPVDMPVEPFCYSAKHWARKAEHFTGSMTNALIFRGSWDASEGQAPPILTPKTPDFYKITQAGIIESVSYNTDDSIVLDVNTDSWFKIVGTHYPMTSDLDVDSELTVASARAVMLLNQTKLAKTETAVAADKLAKPFTLQLTGDSTGQVSLDGAQTAQLPVTVRDNSHNHTQDNIAGLSKRFESLESGLQQISNPNLLINGDFSVWQRGIIFNPSILLYTADRWLASGFSKVEKGTHSGTMLNSVRSKNVLTLITDNSANYKILDQIVEKGAYLLNGQTITVSFIVSHTLLVDFFHQLEIQTVNGIVLAATNVIIVESGLSFHGDVWRKITATLTVPNIDIDANDCHLRCRIVWKPEMTAEQSLWIGEVKLELGSHATPFIPDDPATNLAKCQRYFCSSFALSTPENNAEDKVVLTGSVRSSNEAITNTYEFPIKMRTTPSVTIYSPGRGISNTVANQPSINFQNLWYSTPVNVYPTSKSFHMAVEKSDMTMNQAVEVWFNFTADAEF